MRGPSKNRTRRLSIALASLLVGSTAEAAPPRLDTSATSASCPDADALRRAIAKQLGRDDFDRDTAPDVLVRVKGMGASLGADVVVTSRDGAVHARAIEGAASACEDLVRAAALSVALAIEQDEARAAPKPEPPKAPTPPTPPILPASPPASREAPSDAASAPRRERFGATASAVSTVGLLPRPAAGAAASARLRVSEATSLSVRGLYLPSARMPNDAFALRLAAGGLGACVEPWPGRAVTGFGCAHALVGSWDVADAALPMQRQGALFAAASLSAGVRANVAGPVHVEAAVDGQIPLTRPTILTEGCPPSGFEPPFMAVALWVGAGVSIF